MILGTGILERVLPLSLLVVVVEPHPMRHTGILTAVLANQRHSLFEASYEEQPRDFGLGLFDSQNIFYQPDHKAICGFILCQSVASW